jgi:hypothetical protein
MAFLCPISATSYHCDYPVPGRHNPAVTENRERHRHREAMGVLGNARMDVASHDKRSRDSSGGWCARRIRKAAARLLPAAIL